jgi:hypothetical protein
MTKDMIWSALAIAMAIVALDSPARADEREEALLPIERKISTFTIRITKKGYEHFASADKAPPDSQPAKIVAIDGRSSKDIWMLTETGVVLQDDGKEIKFRQAKPCGWGSYNREFNGLGTSLYNLVVDEDNVHVFGQWRGVNTRIGAERRATLSKNGKWTCTEKDLVPTLVQASGALTWRAAYNMDGDACRIGSSAGHCSSGPRFAPTHEDPSRDSIDMGILNVGMWMHGVDDGWVVTLDEFFQPVLFRFNGVAWTKQTKFADSHRVYSIWSDENRHVWITAGTQKDWDAPANQIFRFDGKTLNKVPTPPSFKTKRVRGHSSRDVWFSGSGDTVYQWDAGRLRQGKVPGEVEEMWVSSDDVAFFVVPGAIAFAAPSKEAP